MYYKGYFRSADTTVDDAGQLFKVVIITNYRNREYAFGGEVMLTDSPFIVNYESEDENLYKPYKCSTATVGILQKDFNPQFQNTKANNVLVKLLKFKNGITEEELNTGTSRFPELVYDEQLYEVEWIGYATPNAYSQRYEDEWDSYEMECQDALSTLQFKKFEMNGNKMLISFLDCIIDNLSEHYSNFFISDSIQIPNVDENTALRDLYVDKRNFFDEDGEAKSMLEVIEQICLYLNLTIIPYKNQIWLLDYNAIKNDYNRFWHIKNLESINVKEDYFDKYEISADSFAENGTTINLLSTYNKISVKDSLYSIETISPNLDDMQRWDSTGMDLDERLSDGYTTIMSVDNLGMTVFRNIRDNKEQFAFIKFMSLDDSNNFGDDSSLRVFAYNKTTNSLTQNENTFRHLRGTNCAQLIAYDVKDTVEPVKVELKPAIMISTQTNNTKTDVSQVSKNEKMLEMTTKTVTVGAGDFFIIKGSIKFYKENDCLPIDEPNNDDKLNYFRIPYSLKFNDKYYSSTFSYGVEYGGWTNSEKIGSLYFDGDIETNAFNTELQFKCNVPYTDLLGVDNGFGVPVPNCKTEDDVETGQAMLTIYNPCKVAENNVSQCCMITDLCIELATQSEINSPNAANDDTDTEYVAEMEDEAVEEKSSIDLDICTWDNKQVNYSAVYYSLGSNLKRFKHYLNKATGELCRPEEHICRNIVNQYTSPTMVINVNLHYQPKPYSLFTYHFFKDKEFIFDGGEFDYSNNKFNLNLTEKK